MVNHTAVKISSTANAEDSHGGGFQNISGREECEAEPVAPGASAGNQVSRRKLFKS